MYSKAGMEVGREYWKSGGVSSHVGGKSAPPWLRDRVNLSAKILGVMPPPPAPWFRQSCVLFTYVRKLLVLINRKWLIIHTCHRKCHLVSAYTPTTNKTHSRKFNIHFLSIFLLVVRDDTLNMRGVPYDFKKDVILKISYKYMETGDRVSSSWSSISFDRLENIQSLGHIYLYLRSGLHCT